MDKDAILSKLVKKINTMTAIFILSSIFGFYSTLSVAQPNTSKISLNSQIALPKTPDTKAIHTSIANSPQWKVWRTNDNSTVSYRASEYKGLLEIKAQATVHSTLSGFIYFIEDLTQVNQWLDNVKSSEIIQQISATENIFITQFKGVWPISAREMLIHSRYWQNDDLSIEIVITDASNISKASNNTIRIQVHRAQWNLIPKKGGELEIIYQFVVDPKGKLPQWLVKSMTLRSIWLTLANLQKQLPLSKWQQHRKTHIKEL